MRRTGNRACSPWTVTEAMRGGKMNEIIRRSVWLRTAAAFIAEEIELLLRRPVGVAEQDGFVLSLMAHPPPTRHDEDVLGPPIEPALADPRAAVAFDGHEYRRVRGSIRSGREARGQELKEGSDGRH